MIDLTNEHADFILTNQINVKIRSLNYSSGSENASCITYSQKDVASLFFSESATTKFILRPDTGHASILCSELLKILIMHFGMRSQALLQGAKGIPAGQALDLYYASLSTIDNNFLKVFT